MGVRAVISRLRKPGHLAVQGALVLTLLVAAASPAFAAKPANPGHGGGGGTSSTTGNDISWPQCGGSYPSGQAFGIVGVNDGVPDFPNPCLQSELTWALSSPGVTTKNWASGLKASLYVNTADPGNTVNGTVINDWPTSGGGGGYGPCTTTTSGIGQDSTGCAWQYGYNMATADVQDVTTAITKDATVPSGYSSPADYPWWLDVETGNTWQSGTVSPGISGQAMNVADLAGMVAGLQAASGDSSLPIGVYSTSSQWTTITGGSSTYGSALPTMPDWIPGARSSSGAQTNCTAQSAFTGGAVALTQWFGHPYDGDVAC